MNNDFIIENGVLVSYNGDGGDVVIPNGVTRIGACAFFDCRNLKEIIIPDSVEEIGAYAFYSCCNLEQITIPDTVTAIGKCAFLFCVKLKSNKSKFYFKATNGNAQCRKFQYSLDKWFEIDGEIKLCECGFHSCKNPFDVFNYYWGKLGRDVRLWLVETDGEVEENDIDNKVVSKRIRFIKELTISELAEYTNKRRIEEE